MVRKQNNRKTKKQNPEENQQENHGENQQENHGENHGENQQENQQENQENQQKSEKKKKRYFPKPKIDKDLNNQNQVSGKNSANKLIGGKYCYDTPPDLELLERLIRVRYLRRDLWLWCIRSLDGKVSLKKLLMRDQENFNSWPLLPRTGGKYELNSNFLAIDCEMIQTSNNNAFPAHISVVNYYGKQVLNVFIKPDSPVVDWCTSRSGVTYEIYERARKAGKAVPLREVSGLIDRLMDVYHANLVGHNIMCVLRALGIITSHKYKYLDTHFLNRFQEECRTHKLKKLMEKYFNVRIQFQSRGHDPLEDARATMLLFRTFQHEFHKACKLDYEVCSQCG